MHTSGVQRILLHYTMVNTDEDMYKISQETKNKLLIIIHPFWITNWWPTWLNNTKWDSSKGDNTRGPRGEVEVNKIPQRHFCFVLILKNPSVLLLPHNPQYSKAWDMPKSLASNWVPQPSKWNNHHISNTLRENPIQMSYRKELKPRPQHYWAM